MRRAFSLVGCLALASAAAGAPTIEYMPTGYIVTDASEDGSVLVGNVVFDGSYETFRWTAETGIERLGRATVPVIGVGAGSPDVSHDGSRVSATILSSDNRATQGVWTLGEGWTETMPPSPADGVVLDQSYGSAWGLSGDGGTLTGFYWRAGPGSAHPSAWTQATGVVGLESTPGRSARVNAANFDGDIVVGWEERSDGAWQPTVWRNGMKTRLVESEAFAEANGVNASGGVIVGDSYNLATSLTVATIWRWDGAAYVTDRIGALPGTIPNLGGAWFSGVDDSGELAVGGNRYLLSPGGNMDGIVWTPESGLVKDVTFLAGLGLSVPPGSDIRAFDAVTPDGSAIIGTLFHAATGFQSFIVRLGVCPADLNGDGAVDFADLNLLLGNYNATGEDLVGDLDGDGDVDFADLNLLLDEYNQTC